MQAVGAKLDEVDAPRASREGLDPDRARSGEELEHARVWKVIAHHVKHGHANRFRCGAHATVLRRHEIASSELSRYDSQWRGEVGMSGI